MSIGRRRTVVATTPAEALERLLGDDVDFDVVVVDRPRSSSIGVGAVRDFVVHAPDIPVIVTTDLKGSEISALLAAGAAEVLDHGELSPETFDRAVAHARARKEFEAELRRIADTDDLTGIGNRRHLARRHAELVARQRRQGGVFAVALFDLDGFKAVNDRLGHGAGDRALRAVADVLGRSARACDVIARVGGDEFVVLSLQGSALTAVGMLDRIHEAVRRALREIDPLLDATIGVAVSDDGHDLERLLASADAELYQAKTAGSGWSHRVA